MWKEGEGWEGGSRTKYWTIKRAKRKGGCRVRREEGGRRKYGKNQGGKGVEGRGGWGGRKGVNNGRIKGAKEWKEGR